MGCVPSSNADHTAVSRSSSIDNKAQQNVELATKKSAPKVVSAPAPVQNIKPKGPEVIINDAVEKETVTEEPELPKLANTAPQDTSQAEHVPVPPVLQIERIPSKEIEVQPPVPSVGPVDEDQLMLDFETFVLFPDVQSVMVDGSVTKDILQELFSIVDKNADGLVNDQEREDLLELISLSYGAKSKPVTPVNNEAANHTSPSSVAASTSNENCAADLPPVPLLTVPPTSAVHVEEVPSSSTATTPTGVAAEDSAPQPPISPVNSEASTSTKSTTGTSGKRKPKVIKFINPEVLLQEAKPVTESRSTDAVEVATPTTVADASVTEVEAREAPPQKKGFMLTRRESFNHRDSTEQGQSRFFNLDAGLLSYMDSTSRKPPFSMTHREIALKGVEVCAKKNIIELIPFAANTGNTEQDEEVDSAREIVILELKNEKECEVWMDAIREHMQFSLGVQ